MKCPLMIAYVPLAMSEDNPAVGDCLEEKCAWWNDARGACGVYLLQERLACLINKLSEIEDKMPHEAQFRK